MSTPTEINPELMAFMAQFGDMEPAHRDAIAKAIQVITPDRGTVLVRPGEVARLCYMIIRGCIRQYTQTEDGKELTTAIFTEGQAVVAFQSFKHGTPVQHYWACVEDCCLIVGDASNESEMYTQYPELEAMTRSMVEMEFGKQQQDFANFIATSPEERYLHLQATRPSVFQRLPQHQIASFLGITPESLSRIRKRLLQRGK